jgi:hypothetical protein
MRLRPLSTGSFCPTDVTSADAISSCLDGTHPFGKPANELG